MFRGNNDPTPQESVVEDLVTAGDLLPTAFSLRLQSFFFLLLLLGERVLHQAGPGEQVKSLQLHVAPEEEGQRQQQGGDHGADAAGLPTTLP